MKPSTIVKLLFSIAFPLTLGSIAGIFTSKAIPVWYETLNKPSFNPPDYLFGPVWTILYLLMGISLFLIWITAPGKERNVAMLLFFVQLALNFFWSFLFFYFNTIGLALAEILILWISILVMMIQFYKIRSSAALLNIPYLLWVTFATVLNAAYFWLN